MRGARFIYLSGSSPMHLRSVLKHSKVWEALVAAWQEGAVVVGSSGAAMALTDPMVDARGGGLTIGLGLLSGLAVVPHFGDTHEDEHGEKLHRSVQLAPARDPGGRHPRTDRPDPRARGRLAFGRGRRGDRLPRRRPGRGRPRRAPGLSAGQSASVMVTDSMTTSSDGFPDRLPTDSMALTTSSPLTTLPKSE